MLLVAYGCKKLGFVENAQEFRDLADEVEESAKPFDFLPRRVRRAGPFADETHHVHSDFRQQLIEQFLTVFEMIIECTLRDTGFFGDAGNRGFRVTVLADDLGGGVEYLALGPGVALDTVEFREFAGCGLR